MINCVLNDQVEKMLSQCVYAIEANSYEQMKIWESVQKHREWEPKTKNPGGFQTVGEIEVDGKKMPVVVSVFCAVYRGHYFCYYEATSQVVDHRMVKKWIRSRVEHTTDAMNMWHCFNHIDRLVEGR